MIQRRNCRLIGISTCLFAVVDTEMRGSSRNGQLIGQIAVTHTVIVAGIGERLHHIARESLFVDCIILVITCKELNMNVVPYIGAVAVEDDLLCCRLILSCLKHLAGVGHLGKVSVRLPTHALVVDGTVCTIRRPVIAVVGFRLDRHIIIAVDVVLHTPVAAPAGLVVDFSQLVLEFHRLSDNGIALHQHKAHIRIAVRRLDLPDNGRPVSGA